MRRSIPPNESADEVEQAFYEALQRGDLDGLMACWAEDDEVVCVHPGSPRLLGLSAIRGAFQTLFEKGGIAVETTRVRKQEAGNGCKVHSVVERVQVSTHDGMRTAYVIATNVYAKTPHGWRLLAHHASPGTLGEPLDASAAPTVLH